MVRNANWMEDRLRFSPPRRFLPVRRTQLLQLPDDVLLRVLRALGSHDDTLKVHNVRDFWNVATTCKRMYVLVVEMMRAPRAWRMVLDDNVPHGVMTTMTDDVMQGVLLALRVGGAGLCALRLGAMQCSQLDAALEQLARHSSLTELSFLDSQAGAMLPEELVRRLKSVSIVSPNQRTLLRLRDAGCEPKTLQLFRVDDDATNAVYAVWEPLMRACSSADVTWMGSAIRGYDQLEQYFPLSDVQRERMRFWSRGYGMPFGERQALSMRELGRDLDSEATFGTRTAWVTEWLRTTNFNAVWMPQVPQWVGPVREGGALSVVIDSTSAAKALLCADGVLLLRLVDELVFGHGGDGRIDMLRVTVPPICSKLDARAVAQVAARVAAAVNEVRVLATSAVVFAELKDVLLPNNLRSVGVVDSFVTSAFVRALPAALAALTKTAGAERSVWVQTMKLRDVGDVQRRDTLLRRAEAACRRAEAAGLCAIGVRGAIERWLRET
eukprot:gb/GEZJ01003378.1/.p1 GENE.gb/GEZJ01003378.1/~~gb/GEZJ01003378.1/.p1  ORF type:complete len:496 (-),score=62.77 gb/GEZJ01003378.1/:3569-5056(-)